MVRCRNFQKTLVIEIVQSPSIINKPLLIFVEYLISGIVRLNSNLSAANANLESHLHRGTLSRFTLHRNLCIMEFYNMLNDRKSKSRTPGLL